MAVGFEGGAVATITLDKPPANSYDLEFMRSSRRRSTARSPRRLVSSWCARRREKFFSAGADVKRFLEGDVDANLQMIRTSQAAFARIAAAPQVFIAYIAGHALGGGLEIALGVRPARRDRGRLQARDAGGVARACCPATAARSG